MKKWRCAERRNTYKRVVTKPDVKRVKRVKRLWVQLPAVVLLIVFVVCIYKLVAYLQLPTTLPIKRIELVTSTPHVTDDRLSRVMLNHLKAGFFTVDQAQLAVKVKQALPWVDQLVMQRVWPDALRVRLTEHVPFAQWKQEALITYEGHLFAPLKASWPAGLPVLDGPVANRLALIAQFESMNKELASIQLRIIGLQQSSRGVVILQLVPCDRSGCSSSTDLQTAQDVRRPLMQPAQPLQLTLGREPIESRLQRFISFYPRVIGNLPVWQRRRIHTVDMRYARGFAVGK